MERRLYVGTEPETFDELRGELNQVQVNNDKLKKELVSSENRSRLLAQTLEESAKIYKDQVTEHVSFSNFSKLVGDEWSVFRKLKFVNSPMNLIIVR